MWPKGGELRDVGEERSWAGSCVVLGIINNVLLHDANTEEPPLVKEK